MKIKVNYCLEEVSNNYIKQTFNIIEKLPNIGDIITDNYIIEEKVIDILTTDIAKYQTSDKPFKYNYYYLVCEQLERINNIKTLIFKEVAIRK